MTPRRVRLTQVRSAALVGGAALVGSAVLLGGAVLVGAPYEHDACAQMAPPNGRLPAGHPPVPDQDDPDESEDNDSAEALPPGHPAVRGGAAASASASPLPPGHPPPSGAAGRPTTPAGQIPSDSSEIDDGLPAGTIAIEVRDVNEAPVGGVAVNLGIVVQSVAKGDSHKQKVGQTDENGRLLFGGLETGVGFAYRVTVPWSRDPSGLDSPPVAGSTSPATAVYAAPPFQLDLSRGERAVVHVYPVTTRLDQALVGARGIVYVALKDDVIQIEELFRVFNFSPVAWVPSNVTVDLPHGFKALNVQKQMSDVGFEPIENQGGRLTGTFPPGQRDLTFSYQIPYDQSESFEFAVGLLPRVQQLKIIAEAAKGMILEVPDFPKAISDRNPSGQRVLVTDRQLKPGERPFEKVRIGLRNLPGTPAGSRIAVVLALLTMAGGIALRIYDRRQRGTLGPLRIARAADWQRARVLLASEIAALDRAHASGEVGPKAHARIRLALIDALGRLIGAEKAL